MKNLIPVLTTLLCIASRGKALVSPTRALVCLFLLPLLGFSARAGTILKADNALTLYQGDSWVGGTAPGASDIGQWDSTVTAANTTNDLGADLTWFGLAILDPAGTVTINAGNALTLGDYYNYSTLYNVVDMTNATADLVLDCEVRLNAPGAQQEWCVGSGRILTVGGLVTGPSRDCGLRKTGLGTLILTNASNTYPGVTDVREGVLICTSIKNTSTPCSLGAPTSPNYGAIGIGSLDTEDVSHEGTFKYVGPGDITGRIFRMYARSVGGTIDASGTGPLVITNTGASVINAGPTPSTIKTLTLKGDNTGTNTIGGTIGNHSSLMPTALAKEGVGKWVLTAADLYTGGTTISGGTLEIGPAGSIQGHVSVANGAVLQLDNPTALPATNVLTLDASPSAATINLNYSPTQTISALYFGGTQQAAGTWGALGSSAAHPHAAFTGPGILMVTTGSTATCSQTNALVGIAGNLDGSFTLTFVGTPQAQYYVLASPDAGALMSNWSPLPGSTNTATDPSGLWQVTVTNAAPAQFYRGAAVAPCP